MGARLGLALVHIGSTGITRPPRLAAALMGVPDVNADKWQRAAVVLADVVTSGAA